MERANLTHRDYAAFARLDDATLERDCTLEVFRATGPGGQGVNTTDSAVRLRHLPTGITVTARETRSQYRNRQLALAKPPRRAGAPCEAPAQTQEDQALAQGDRAASGRPSAAAPRSSRTGATYPGSSRRLHGKNALYATRPGSLGDPGRCWKRGLIGQNVCPLLGHRRRSMPLFHAF